MGQLPLGSSTSLVRDASKSGNLSQGRIGGVWEDCKLFIAF